MSQTQGMSGGSRGTTEPLLQGWTIQENLTLTSAVQRYGEDWNAVSSIMHSFLQYRQSHARFSPSMCSTQYNSLRSELRLHESNGVNLNAELQKLYQKFLSEYMPTAEHMYTALRNQIAKLEEGNVPAAEIDEEYMHFLDNDSEEYSDGDEYSASEDEQEDDKPPTQAVSVPTLATLLSTIPEPLPPKVTPIKVDKPKQAPIYNTKAANAAVARIIANRFEKFKRKRPQKSREGHEGDSPGTTDDECSFRDDSSIADDASIPEDGDLEEVKIEYIDLTDSPVKPEAPTSSVPVETSQANAQLSLAYPVEQGGNQEGKASDFGLVDQGDQDQPPENYVRICVDSLDLPENDALEIENEYSEESESDTSSQYSDSSGGTSLESSPEKPFRAPVPFTLPPDYTGSRVTVITVVSSLAGGEAPVADSTVEVIEEGDVEVGSDSLAVPENDEEDSGVDNEVELENTDVAEDVEFETEEVVVGEDEAALEEAQPEENVQDSESGLQTTEEFVVEGAVESSVADEVPETVTVEVVESIVPSIETNNELVEQDSELEVQIPVEANSVVEVQTPDNVDAVAEIGTGISEIDTQGSVDFVYISKEEELTPAESEVYPEVETQALESGKDSHNEPEEKETALAEVPEEMEMAPDGNNVESIEMNEVLEPPNIIAEVQDQDSEISTTSDKELVLPAATAEEALATPVATRKRKRGTRLQTLYKEASTFFPMENFTVPNAPAPEVKRVTRARRRTGGLSTGGNTTPALKPLDEENETEKFPMSERALQCMKFGIDLAGVKKIVSRIKNTTQSDKRIDAPVLAQSTQQRGTLVGSKKSAPKSQEEKRILLSKVEKVSALKESTMIKRKAANSTEIVISKFLKCDATLPTLRNQVKDGSVSSEPELQCSLNLMLMNAMVLKRARVQEFSKKVWHILEEEPKSAQPAVLNKAGPSRSRVSSTSSSTKASSSDNVKTGTKRAGRSLIKDESDTKRGLRSTSAGKTEKMLQDDTNPTSTVNIEPVNQNNPVSKQSSPSLPSRQRGSTPLASPSKEVPFLRSQRSSHKN